MAKIQSVMVRDVARVDGQMVRCQMVRVSTYFLKLFYSFFDYLVTEGTHDNQIWTKMFKKN